MSCFINCYAEVHYAEWCYAECCYAECHGAEEREKGNSLKDTLSSLQPMYAQQ